ncbi:hypothetical protein QQM79_16285 [Marinobacteraceae bacterium S3BR75-40.1]
MDSILTVLAEKGFPLDEQPSPHTLPSPLIAAWPQQVLVAVTGLDARRFLQGQVTCNLDDLTAKTSLLGALCTPKGRAIVTFRVLDAGEQGLLLRMPASLAPTVIEHLDKFRVFFKAEMAVQEDWTAIGLVGRELLPRLGLEGDSTLAPGAVVALDGAFLVATQPLPDGTARFELWLSRQAVALLDALPPEHRATPGAWHYSEIQAGLASLTEATSGQYVPQHLNWHALEGISFKKGCYTGQEVIARMRYLGQLKKSTVRFEAAGTARIGQTLVDDSGKNVGQVIDRVVLDDHSCALLAVTQHSALSGTLQLDGQDTPLTRQPQGYAMPEQDE